MKLMLGNCLDKLKELEDNSVDSVETDPSDISGWSKTGSKASENRAMSGANYDRPAKPDNPQGRFPANLIHDGSDEVVELAGDSARFFYCAKASRKIVMKV